MQAARIPDAEALARPSPSSVTISGASPMPVLPQRSRDLAGDARADGAVEVVHRIGEVAAAPAVDGARACRRASARRARPCRRAHCADRCSTAACRTPALHWPAAACRSSLRCFEVSPGRISSSSVRPISSARLRTPMARHDLAAFLRHEPEVVDHHLRQADEILGAQHVVLRGDAGGAIVEMADAQVLAAQRHHGRGAETEALGADERRLDDVEPGLQVRRRSAAARDAAARWRAASDGSRRARAPTACPHT